MGRSAAFLLLTVCSPLIVGKPQYGAAPVQTPVSAPVVQAPSQISCFTTQETVREQILLIYFIQEEAKYIGYIGYLMAVDNIESYQIQTLFLATLVALHFTPVSK